MHPSAQQYVALSMPPPMVAPRASLLHGYPGHELIWNKGGKGFHRGTEPTARQLLEMREAFWCPLGNLPRMFKTNPILWLR